MPKRADVETSRFFIEMRFADACLAPVDDMSVFSSGLLDSFGFFYKNRHNPYLKSAADIFSLRGAILVAEGGLGKTYVIDSFAAQISKTSYIKIAAGEYCGNSTDFSADLSKIPDDIEYIFIDGVDEAPDVIPTLLRKLKLIIREHDHIHIFIALRNIRQLKAVHDELSLPIYSLLPLSRDDVILIAKQKNLDGAAFIDKVVREGLAPICAKPQGCNALISGYKNNKLENTTCQKLWEQSILSLCAENDSSTRLAGETDSSCITPEECLRQSAKIALILKLSGNNVVRGIQNSLPDASEKSVFLSSFYESDAAAKINTILSRAIFMPIGNNRFRFSHFSYFDYLTAIGLLNAVNPKHWETILLSPDKTAVYPCWEGAAAWLAAYTPEWCDIILDIQPELLLVSDYAISMAGAEKLCYRKQHIFPGLFSAG